jgi:hypothetical protein
MSQIDIDRLTAALRRMRLEPPDEVERLRYEMRHLSIADGANFQWPGDILAIMQRLVWIQRRIDSALTLQRVFRGHISNVLVETSEPTVTRYNEVPVRRVLSLVRANGGRSRVLLEPAATHPDLPGYRHPYWVYHEYRRRGPVVLHRLAPRAQ